MADKSSVKETPEETLAEIQGEKQTEVMAEGNSSAGQNDGTTTSAESLTSASVSLSENSASEITKSAEKAAVISALDLEPSVSKSGNKETTGCPPTSGSTKEFSVFPLKRGTRKRPSSKIMDSVTSGDEDASKGVEHSPKMETTDAGKVPKPTRGTFVPHYEPIQTRKRTKAPYDSPSLSIPSTPKKKDVVPRTPRPRLSKDEVLTPDIGPRPKAVPKSLLILEPELLPRKFKKKQSHQQTLSSSFQIHTSAEVEKDPSISWPTTSEGIKTSMPSSLEVSSLLLAAASETENTRQEIRVEQGEDGTTSYILTSVPSSNGVVSEGQIANVQEGLVTDTDGQFAMVEESVSVQGEQGETVYTVISDASTSGSKTDTPTSLLLLAEAAYPTTAAEPQTSTSVVLTSSVTTPSSDKTCPATSVTKLDDGQEKADSIPPKTVSASAPTVMTVTSSSSSVSVATASSDTQTGTDSTGAVVPSSTDQWSCIVCGEFVDEDVRTQHVAQHLDNEEEEEEEEEEVVCDACGEQFRDEEELELHMAVEHDEEEGEGGDGDFDENEEEDSVEQTETLQTVTATTSASPPPQPAVLTTALGAPVHTCGQCGETFPYAAYLRQHMKNAHSEAGAVFTCSRCPKTFTTKTALENHSRLHQMPGGSITFKCIRCMQQFSSAALLSSHAQTCLQRSDVPTIKSGRGRGRGRGQGRGRSSDYSCTVCNKTFTSEVFLKAHQLSHSCSTARASVYKSHPGASGLQCLYCPEKFRRIGLLKEHILAKHPKAFPFKCSICHRGFSRDNSRISHEQTHQTEKLFLCSECGEGFTLQAYLNRHMKYRHLKLVKFPCQVCRKEFVRQADLIKHRRVHTGEKPYTCEQCGHGFGQQSNYKYHMMRHRGEKPYTCPMCNKGFRVPSHLKMHMQQHLNERFVCMICDKVFSQSRYLQRHLRTHNVRQVRSADVLPVTTATTSANNGSVGETLVTYNPVTTASQPARTEQQIIVDSMGNEVTEHMVVQDLNGEVEPVIEFVINNEDDNDVQGKKMEQVDSEGIVVMTTTSQPASENQLKVEIEGEEASGAAESSEEQAYVNADEGTSVVVGAFSEGEGGSMEEGNVTLPFKDLTQLIGGKHYNCDVCSESFSIRPNSTYNMIHTGQSHILVISLNDHNHQEQNDA